MLKALIAFWAELKTLPSVARATNRAAEERYTRQAQEKAQLKWLGRDLQAAYWVEQDPYAERWWHRPQATYRWHQFWK